ncbi:hypothetical protein CALVIDRAFT_99675 [Calocera viscosa TUFC12733]|uniref:Uncharacterized protein n=1 Tax=Calocera viscosa (strain TUFC12733) TaxID=1330018 RepID=A0A167MKU5_CALVF|nr:hypothetical protein CALVIDRAFT_99675 [Calocera viscosa TUFC12733]
MPALSLGICSGWEGRRWRRRRARVGYQKPAKWGREGVGRARARRERRCCRLTLASCARGDCALVGFCQGFPERGKRSLSSGTNN